MALNIPPAPGVTPAQAAKELRVMLKGAAAADGDTSANTLLWKQRVEDQRRIIADLKEQLVKELDILVDLAKQRRPSTVRTQVSRIKQNIIAPLNVRLAYEQNYTDRLLQEARKSGGVGFDAARAYALVQTLPTIDEPPLGKDENTIRALTAVIKAHHGLLEEGPEKMPDGELPLVLLQRVREEREPDLWLPPERPEKRKLFPLPFRIIGRKQPISNSSITAAFVDKGYGAAGMIGSVENWNGGDCSFQDALDTLRAVRARYGSPRFMLRDANGYELAYAHVYEEVMLTVYAEQQLGLVPPTTISTYTTSANTISNVTTTDTTVPF